MHDDIENRSIKKMIQPGIQPLCDQKLKDNWKFTVCRTKAAFTRDRIHLEPVRKKTCVYTGPDRSALNRFFYPVPNEFTCENDPVRNCAVPTQHNSNESGRSKWNQTTLILCKRCLSAVYPKPKKHRTTLSSILGLQLGDLVTVIQTEEQKRTRFKPIKRRLFVGQVAKNNR